MKKLEFPKVDDIERTTDLSRNRLLRQTSYPHLSNRLREVLGSYQRYTRFQGNALKIEPMNLEDPLKSGLKSNYSHPPSSLSYIDEIRSSSPRVCPMCGSLKPHTLDHVLPKEDYSEFAIYSRNLVPACDCNIKRGRTLVERDASARVLHPYFDDCLSDRLLSCEISPFPEFPMADIKIRYLKLEHPLAKSVRFHVESIVVRAGIVTWLSGQWSSFVECPSAVVQTLPHAVIGTDEEMKLSLQDAIGRHDKNLGTPNNWESIFVHGLIHSPGVIAWSRQVHNKDY